MNRSLTSDRKVKDHCFPIAKAKYKILTLALVAAGYEADRYTVLEPECSFSRPELEERKAEWVCLYLDALALGVDLDTLPNISDCELIAADDAEFTGSYASLVTALVGANNDLIYTARQIGGIGNIYSVVYIDPAANDEPLSVELIGSVITVTLGTGVAGAIESTATEIKTQVEQSSSCNSLVAVSLNTGNSGAGVVTAMAETNLSGGTN